MGREKTAQEPLKAFAYYRPTDLECCGVTIAFRSLGGADTCGSGDFATVTGYYRPGRRELRG